jgi:hypothetical protein
MAYTKLFQSIITSTIWSEDDKTRIVWITMLALADKNGEVQGSVPGIARIAGVGVEDARSAIEKFLSPDPDSRSKDDEGRRAEVIDGGWFLINHPKYRQMASDDDRKKKAAERQQRFRDKEKRNAVVTPPSPQNPQAKANSDSDSQKPECPIPVASDETRSFLDSLWKLSPRTSRPRTSRKDVTAAWKSIPAKDRPTHDEALAAYLAWTKCEAWTKENGQYVCGLHLWIRKRQWENVPEGATPGATPGAGCRKLSNEKGF